MPLCEKPRHYGGAGDQSAWAIAANPAIGDESVVAGDFSGDITLGSSAFTADAAVPSQFLARINSTYGVPWARSFPAPYEASAVDAHGKVVFVMNQGAKGPCPNVSPLENAKLVVKLAASDSGSCAYLSAFAPWTGQTFLATVGDEVIVVGTFEGALDFGGGTDVLHSASGSKDFFVVKLDVNGNVVSSARFGGPGDEVARALVVDAQGDAIVAGDYDGTIDLGNGDAQTGTGAFVSKVGSQPWSKIFRATGQEAAKALAISGASVLFAGELRGTLETGHGPALEEVDPAIYAMALDNDAKGEVVWVRTFGGQGAKTVESIASGESGRFALTGAFEEAVDFSDDKKSPLSNDLPHPTIFVAELDASGKHLGSWAFGGSSGPQLGRGLLWRGEQLLVVGHFSGDVDFGAGASMASVGGTDAFVVCLSPP